MTAICPILDNLKRCDNSLGISVSVAHISHLAMCNNLFISILAYSAFGAIKKQNLDLAIIVINNTRFQFICQPNFILQSVQTSNYPTTQT